jgi:hypothetical protein
MKSQKKEALALWPTPGCNAMEEEEEEEEEENKSSLHKMTGTSIPARSSLDYTHYRGLRQGVLNRELDS